MQWLLGQMDEHEQVIIRQLTDSLSDKAGTYHLQVDQQAAGMTFYLKTAIENAKEKGITVPVDVIKTIKQAQPPVITVSNVQEEKKMTYAQAVTSPPTKIAPSGSQVKTSVSVVQPAMPMVMPTEKPKGVPLTTDNLAAIINAVQQQRNAPERGQPTCFRCHQPGHRVWQCQDPEVRAAFEEQRLVNQQAVEKIQKLVPQYKPGYEQAPRPPSGRGNWRGNSGPYRRGAFQGYRGQSREWSRGQQDNRNGQTENRSQDARQSGNQQGWGAAAASTQDKQ